MQLERRTPATINARHFLPRRDIPHREATCRPARSSGRRKGFVSLKGAGLEAPAKRLPSVIEVFSFRIPSRCQKIQLQAFTDDRVCQCGTGFPAELASYHYPHGSLRTNYLSTGEFLRRASGERRKSSASLKTHSFHSSGVSGSSARIGRHGLIPLTPVAQEVLSERHTHPHTRHPAHPTGHLSGGCRTPVISR